MLEGTRQPQPRHVALRHSGNIPAHERHLAGRHRRGAGHQVEHGRLAGTVRSDQAHDLAGMHFEAHIIHRHQAAEPLHRTGHRKYWRATGGQGPVRQRLDLHQGLACVGGCHRRWGPAPHKTHQTAASKMQQQDEQRREHNRLQLTRRLGQHRQHVLQSVLQDQHQRRSDQGAAEVTESPRHRHQQVFDAGPHVERRRADEAVHVRVQPARQPGEQCRRDEQRQPYPVGVRAHTGQQYGTAAQAADGPARARTQDVVAEQKGQADQTPDQVIDGPRTGHRPAADKQRRDVGQAGMPSQCVDVAKQHGNGNAPCDGAEWQKMPAQTQRQHADAQR